MLDIDWRSAAAYQHAIAIPASGFAWEYLRRDDDYHRDFDRLSRRKPPAATTLEAFSQRWGLRFPTQSVGAGRS
jgi:transcriptional regulator